MNVRMCTTVLGVSACLLAACDRKPPESTSLVAQPKLLASWDFDEEPRGEAPQGFVARQNNPTREMAVWSVAPDPTAYSAPHLLAVHTLNDNATFNLLLAEGTAFKDLDIRVQVRGDTGEHDRGGGMIWRARDENNYYVCRMNPLETNFRVYKVVDGKRQQLQSAEGVATESGRWYEVRAVMAGNQIQCWLDDRKLLDVTDDTFTEAGMIGLWTKADASSAFDSLVVLEPVQSN